ncbi:type II toxin-antitoxin system RelE/ParE family toxin [Membranicola marinus]|uniref:Type II toxin-antitoxin system RelE/ParE family toxin n=1 Tax=Membranihabitans marinus TaxID=1227546 RepID=A0A953LBU4_9BACT|nr:type II toxin-antitoxin system RelE/ParE family toxin [Membranihabitans marinus]MBY5957044.1 type II toxin-antitoxin system RelE/ParE family toxin [Membranihabitans marinus]
MKRKIVLSNTAEKRLNNLLEYLEIAWSTKIKLNFLSKLEQRLEIVKDKPEIFPLSTVKKGLHKCVVTRQTTVYYTYDDQKVYVLTVFDNRQDPNKLKKDVK